MAAAFLTDIRSGETGLDETGDAQLIEACRRRDPEAFRSLFERYKDRVYSVALRYCGDASLAQDIAQETFIKLFSAIGSFRGDSRFESWLYRLVVNSCFDHKRKSRRLFPLVDGFLGHSARSRTQRSGRHGARREKRISAFGSGGPASRAADGHRFSATRKVFLTRQSRRLWVVRPEPSGRGSPGRTSCWKTGFSRIPGIKSEAGGKYSV